MAKYTWEEFELDESSDAIAGKYLITIHDGNGEEVAVIVHRTCEGRFPLDGTVAGAKRDHAQRIVNALNRAEGEEE